MKTPTAPLVILLVLVGSSALGCRDEAREGRRTPTGAGSAALSPGKAPATPAAPAPRALTTEECRALAEHILDVAANEALDEEKAPPAERKKRLAMLRAELAADPELRRDSERCDDDYTRGDYGCILGATSMAAIERCQGVAD